MSTDTADSVRRLRARLRTAVSHDEALRYRLRVSNLLQHADVRPTSLPPSSVLVVRSVTASVTADALLPGFILHRTVWERKLRDHIATYARSAARPVKGRVPASAMAVLFTDPSEWLACMAVDMGMHRTGTVRWWWPPDVSTSFPKILDKRDVLSSQLCRQPHRVPAVVDHLVRWGRVEDGFRPLADSSVRLVLDTVCAAFGLKMDSTDPKLPLLPTPSIEANNPRLQSDHRTARRDRQAIQRLQQELAPGLLPTLTPVKAVLLFAALALHRIPALARTAGFANALLDLRDTNVNLESATIPETKIYDGVAAETPDSHVVNDGFGAVATAVEATRNAKQIATQVTHTATRRRLLGGKDNLNEDSAEVRQTTPMAREHVPSSSAEFTDDSGRGTTSSKPNSLITDGIETRLAGVFYLLNVFISLDVRSTFDSCFQNNCFGTWALLEVVARALLSYKPSDANDPIWTALTHLDGRTSGSNPANDVLGDNDIVLPASWVKEFNEQFGAWQWAIRKKRLCLWNEYGLPVALVRCDDRPPSKLVYAILDRLGVVPTTLRRQPFAHAPLTPLRAAVADAASEGLCDWLAVVVPFLRYRLKLALGHTATLDDMLRRPGRIHLTSSHVDLVQPLDSVSLAARLAGLDRDPGWLPSEGRVVLFHFRDTMLALG